MKGIGELLEGLIPYSQRHFSRIDRLVRSTFLLDYTLTGMSVIEPETDDVKNSKDNNHLDENLLAADVGEEEKQNDSQMLNSKSAIRKRKSDKHRDASRTKKVKGVAYTAVF